MSQSTYTRITLAERPKADITSTTFKTETTASFAELKPGEGQALVQVEWLSLDPAMRGWLNDKRSYLPPVQIGEVMRAGGIGLVLEAGPGSKFKKGDAVRGMFGMSATPLLGPVLINSFPNRMDRIRRSERQGFNTRSVRHQSSSICIFVPTNVVACPLASSYWIT